MNRLQPLKIGGSMERAGLARRQPRRNPRRPVFFSSGTYRITGITKDSTGAALANCIVDLFYSLDDVKAATVESSSLGEFTFWVTPHRSFYIVAYKAGVPDVAGTTVNTLVATFSGETSSYDVDAQDFFTRVVANSGTINDGCKAAVNQFVLSAKANGYWTKLNRINLFVGDQLAAALVPLKVGSGSATDTNVNFVGGDYSLATGLTGNGTTKYLDTGLLANALTANDTHLAVYNRSSLAAGGAGALGASNNNSFFAPFSDGVAYSDQYNPTTGRVSIAITGPYGFIIGSRTSATAHELYKNGSSIASNATGGGTLPAISYFVFATSNVGVPANLTSHNFASYSIGSGLTSGNVTSYNTDLEALQDDPAIARGVQ